MSNKAKEVETMCLGEDHLYKVGDRCIIVVNDVNSPTGTWEGEVTFAAEEATAESGYRRVRAKITDPKVKSRGAQVDYARFFEAEPTVNYSVYPFNTFTRRLFDWIESLEGRLTASHNAAALREEGFKRALVALATGQAEEKATAAYERGLRDAREEAAKKEKAAKVVG